MLKVLLLRRRIDEKKKELDVNFAKDIEASSELLKNREIEIKKEYDESIKINENKFIAIEETEKEYLKDLEVIRKKLKSIYSLEYEAFENTTKDRLKNASKNLEEKYKKPTVYQLQGKEKED